MKKLNTFTVDDLIKSKYHLTAELGMFWDVDSYPLLEECLDHEYEESKEQKEREKALATEFKEIFPGMAYHCGIPNDKKEWTILDLLRMDIQLDFIGRIIHELNLLSKEGYFILFKTMVAFLIDDAKHVVSAINLLTKLEDTIMKINIADAHKEKKWEQVITLLEKLNPFEEQDLHDAAHFYEHFTDACQTKHGIIADLQYFIFTCLGKREEIPDDDEYVEFVFYKDNDWSSIFDHVSEAIWDSPYYESCLFNDTEISVYDGSEYYEQHIIGQLRKKLIESLTNTEKTPRRSI